MSTAALATLVLLGGFFVLIFLKVPVTFALLISTLASAFINATNFTVMVRMMIDGVNNFSLLAIPFFILMGEIMAAGKVSDKIIDLANLIVGRFKGGLAYVNCISSMFFGGISGSAVADVSSMGSVVVPMMKKQGYNAEFSVGLTVVTSCQGVLIPPSHNMVIYALAAGGGVSIARMFIAGAIPGFFLGFSLLLYCFVLRNRKHFPGGIHIGEGNRVRWMAFHTNAINAWGYTKTKETWLVISTPFFTWEMGKCVQVLINAILPMMTIVIIMGGVATGIFTATESAAIACVYTFLLTYFVFKSAKLRDFGHVLKNTLKTLAIVLTLIATAKAFSYMMTDLRIPDMITRTLVSISSNKYVLLLIINLLLLILGCFMDMAPLIMIMTPILLPIVTNDIIGMSPIHFGIMLIFNLAVGLCTPPVGSALFVGCAVGKTSIEKTSRSMLGMFSVMVFCLMIITYVPSFSLWLPSLIL